MKEMKRVLALLLCFVMLVGYVPVGALAEEADTAPAVAEIQEESAATAENTDAEPAQQAQDVAEEAVEEIVEAVMGPVISASKPVEAPEAETEAAEEETEAPEAETEATEEETEAPEAETEATEEVTEPETEPETEPVEEAEEEEEVIDSEEEVYAIAVAPEGEAETASATAITEAYIRATSLTAGEKYVISQAATAGDSRAMLTNADGSVGNTYAPILAGNSTYENYIEAASVTDGMVWTVDGRSNNWTFKNGDYYLNRSSNVLQLSTSSSTWSYDNRRLSYSVGFGMFDSTTYRLYCSNGTWGVRYGYYDDNVYLYKYQKNSAEYTVSANDIAFIYPEDGNDTVSLADIRTLKADGAPTGAAAAWTAAVVSDPNGIVDTEASTGDVLAFTGKTGAAQVRLYAEISGVKAWTTINVTATAPYYSIEICDAAGAQIDSTVTLKDVAAGDTHELSYTVKRHDRSNPEGAIQKVNSADIAWESSNEAVATVENGVLTFTGEEYGTFEVTAKYMEFGIPVCYDAIDVSAAKDDLVFPEDGTNDYPEYPNEGAIRINKTASAVGNFSSTGTAEVELSMTGEPCGMDVVIMMDMSTSMTYNNNKVADRVKAAKNAAKNALKALVQRTDGSYNENRVAIYTFNGWNETDKMPNEDAVYEVLKNYPGLQSYGGSGEPTLKTANEAIDDVSTGAGTNYSGALWKCEQILKDARSDEKYANRSQFVIFLTDGLATTGFAYLDDNGEMQLYGNDYLGDDGTKNDENLVNRTEYYSHVMKQAGVGVYSIALQLSSNTAGDNGRTILKKIAGNADGNATTEENESYFDEVLVSEDVSVLDSVFQRIVNDIKEAATDVQVDDLVGEYYKLSFPESSLLSGKDPYFQVVEYQLDEQNERKGDPAVLEKFTYTASGFVHTYKNSKGEMVTCTDCTHITANGNEVITIDGEYVGYDGVSEKITWISDKISRTEIALQYFVTLKDMDTLEPGSYPTNEYATVTYTNFNGNRCQQYFPVPQLTWKGAQVSYVFYLVNEKGVPVNRAGREIPFAEAVYVTDPIRKSVTWNNPDGISHLSADYLAKDLVPEVYKLYDSKAYYEVRVYETEGVDEDGVSLNYFRIDGSTQAELTAAQGTTAASVNTTKVFNTRAGARYDTYGVYSEKAVGTTVADGVVTDYQTRNLDYGNTTVAFAVTWTPKLAPDTVVVDYGLDVVIDVALNDGTEVSVSGVRTDRPNAVENTGSYTNTRKQKSVDVYLDSLRVGTAKVENNTSVRFIMDKANAMQFTDPAKFFYEADCTWYDADKVLTTSTMYSTVTVIPAANIYYEDEYVELKTFRNGAEVEGWVSKASTGVQDADRPGLSGNTAGLPGYDANNVYGYDGAYDNCSTYSMDNAAKVTVDENTYATATFDFYGTGFDIVGMTSNTTGTMIIQVRDAQGEVKSYTVDTYYGYNYCLCDVTYVYAYAYKEVDGETVRYERWQMPGGNTAVVKPNPDGTPNEFPEDPAIGDTFVKTEMYWYQDNTNGAQLYQVPVMKVTDLPYGKYTATLTAAYSEYLDHTEDGAYDLYLDAIRIYNPAGVTEEELGTEIKDAYLADKEAWPKYFELRNLILDAAEASGEAELPGVVFIDGNAKAASVADYKSYGPNNEVYLAADQAISFTLDLGAYNGTVADVQVGLKSANGEEIALEMTAGDNSSTASIASSTDRFYSIGNHVNLDGETVITFKNTSGVASITNIKLTFTEQPDAAAASIAPIVVKEAAVASVLARMNAGVEQKPEVTVDADLDVNIRTTSVKVGATVVVKATTSADVASLSVNGKQITKFTENRQTGKRSWTATVKAEKAGDLEIEVAACDAKGETLETAAETVTVTAKKASLAKQAIDTIISKLFG